MGKIYQAEGLLMIVKFANTTWGDIRIVIYFVKAYSFKHLFIHKKYVLSTSYVPGIVQNRELKQRNKTIIPAPMTFISAGKPTTNK